MSSPRQFSQALEALTELKIANELIEKQSTNLAELMLIRHPGNSEALIDKYGTVQTISLPQTPLSAITSNGSDFTRTIASKDNQVYPFNDNDQKEAINSIILTFPSPDNGTGGKLVVTCS